MFAYLARSFNSIPAMGQRIVYSAVTGVVAGLGAVFFYLLLQLGVHFLLGEIVGYWAGGPGGEPPLFPEGSGELRRWLLLVVPTLGGLLSGFIVFRWAPEAEGHGTDAAIEAYHFKGGFVRSRVPLIKAISSALTLGTGGSGGREGPIAQIGSGFGSYLATRLGLSERERRILMATGMGAGIGAIFKSPLAGALFAGEVLYSEEQLEHDVLLPATIASVVAYSIFCTFFGWGPLFHTPPFHFNRIAEFLPYTVLAFACTLFGILYVRCFYSTHRLFKRLPIPDTLKPAVGGLLMGIVGYFFPPAISMGYGVIQHGLDGTALPSLLIGVALLKILTTSFSIGSGGSGGVFGPGVVIGGAIGGSVGLLFQRWLPATVSNPGAFVIVGMAGFFGGVAKTPISTIIMVSEMTGNYHLLVPSMWVCSITFLLLRRWKLYEKQLANRLESPAHHGELIVDALEDVPVRDWMTRSIVSVPEAMRAYDIVEYVKRTRHKTFPVLAPNGVVVGLLNLRDVLEVVAVPNEVPVIAHDLIQIPSVTVEADSSLSQALSSMYQNRVEMLIVVEPPSEEMCGILTRRDLMDAYDHITTTVREHRPTTTLHRSALDTTPIRHIVHRDFDTVSEDNPLSDILQLEEASETIDFPVVDVQGDLLGMVAYKDFRAATLEPTVQKLLLARDLLRPVKPLDLNATLAQALAAFSTYDLDCLPIVENHRLCGVLHRADLMDRYHDLLVR